MEMAVCLLEGGHISKCKEFSLCGGNCCSIFATVTAITIEVTLFWFKSDSSQ